MKKLLGIPADLYCRPLVHTLRAGGSVDLVPDTVGKNAIELRERRLSGALLTPLDYARESSDYVLVPDVAVSSSGANDAVVLHFRSGIRTVRTLAVYPGSAAEIVLAKVLLAEQFDIEPAIVPVAGSLDAMLQRADAALLVGDAAIMAASGHLDTLDLVEEWTELSDLPYVHRFWCFRENDLSPEDVTMLQDARKQGRALLLAIAEDAVGDFASSRLTPQALQNHLAAFSYGIDAAVREGAGEFLHYAYYHGVIPDIPELKFFHEHMDGDFPSIALN